MLFRLTRIIGLILVFLSLSACLSGGGSSSGATDLTSSTLSTKQLSDVSIELKSVSDSRFAQVIINVAEVELVIGQGSKGNRVVVTQNLGPVDLVQLNQGINLIISNLQIPEGVYVREIRVRLHNEGHYATDLMGQVCVMQTPSAQQSGLKLKLSDKMLVSNGDTYKIVAEFNTNKAIVVQGNGGCLLKPVIRLGSLTKQVSDDDDLTPDPEYPVDPVYPEEPVSEEPVAGVDYIIDGDTVLIPQGDGTYIVIEGVNLNLISIEDILAIYGM